MNENTVDRTPQPQTNSAAIVTPGSFSSQQGVISEGLNHLPTKRGFFEVRAPLRNFIKVLLILNAITVDIPLFYYAYNYSMGTESSALISVLLIPLMVIFAIPTLIANFIYIPIFLIKSKPSAGYALLSTVTLLLPIIALTAYALTQ